MSSRLLHDYPSCENTDLENNGICENTDGPVIDENDRAREINCDNIKVIFHFHSLFPDVSCFKGPWYAN